MKVFFGSAIQGAGKRGERAELNRIFLEAIREAGFQVATEHTTSMDKNEAHLILEKRIGPIPEKDSERRIYIRDKMIEFIEGDIAAAIFEVSLPSLGTGVEIAHAYLRPRMDLKEIPLLILYQSDYWPNNLSTMIRGLSAEKYPFVEVVEYKTEEEAVDLIGKFLKEIR